MAPALPDSYKALGRSYGVRLKADEFVYEQGAVTGHFYVVTDGRVQFKIVDAGGALAVVHEAGVGECFGHVSAFSDRPTSAAAIAAESTVLLSIPADEAAEAFKMSPELAVAIVTQVADQGRPGRRQSAPRDPDDVAADPDATDAKPAQQQIAREAAQRKASRLEEAVNEEWFFRDDALCPISGTLFEYVRVRTGAVKPISRDSDFRVVYRTVDPTFYSVIVCPDCSYAAYHDDFEEVTEVERRALIAAQADRDMFGRPNICGERTLAEAATSFELGLACYEVRRADDRRRAGLLHRRAWLERIRGDGEEERRLLAVAAEGYRLAYERDESITDPEALRAAYLIGDLLFRLGEIEQSARWLSTCVEMPEAKVQTGIARMARDRLYEARQLVFGNRGQVA